MPSRARCAPTRRPRRTSASSTPRSSRDSFAQLEQFKQYYKFPDHLDVDRYEIDGKSQDAVIAVRELNLDGLGVATTGSTDTTVYTHGYGMVAAYGNQRSADGQPVFLESGIPTEGALGEFEPRMYFGESSPSYSIVGAPEGTKPVELDYPAGDGRRNQQTYTTFDGDAGPKLDNVVQQADLRAQVPVGADLPLRPVTDESQILYDRDPHRPRAEGRAVPDARLRRVPVGCRRPGQVDRRRVHDLRRATRTRPMSA